MSSESQPMLASGKLYARFAPVTSVLIAINVLVFLLMALTSGALLDFSAEDLVQWGAGYGPLTVSGQWWRLLSSTFVHAGLLHIGFNMWCLKALGPLPERLFGRGAFLAGYLATGICASLVSLVFHPHSVSMGASGAVFGVAGFTLPAFALRKVPAHPHAMQAIVKNLVWFTVVNLVLGAAIPGIDNAAHVGGFVSGLLIGLFFAWRVGRRRDSRDGDITAQMDSGNAT